MKTYVFTYYNGCDLESFYKAQEFTFSGTRLSQAVRSFADFLNSLPGFRDFSSCYRVNTANSTEFRYFKSSYFDLFEIVKPCFSEV